MKDILGTELSPGDKIIYFAMTRSGIKKRTAKIISIRSELSKSSNIVWQTDSLLITKPEEFRYGSNMRITTKNLVKIPS